MQQHPKTPTLEARLCTQVLLEEAGRTLLDLAKPGASAQSQQLGHAALELLPILLAGAGALLKQGEACDTPEMLRDNHQLASTTVVRLAICLGRHTGSNDNQKEGHHAGTKHSLSQPAACAQVCA